MAKFPAAGIFLICAIDFLAILKSVTCIQNDSTQLQITFSAKKHGESIKSIGDLTLVVPDIVKDLTVVCKSTKCPVEWKLGKFRYAKFSDELRLSFDFKSFRYIDETDFQNPSKYNYSAELNLKGQNKFLTGKYICSCINEPETNRSVYVYWEGSSSTFLLQGEQKFDIFRSPNSPWVTLFCGVSKNDMPIYLFKVHRNGTTEPISTSSSVTEDIDGFHLNLDTLPNPDGTYLCSISKIVTQTTSELLYARYNVQNQILAEKPLYIVSEWSKLSEESKDTVFFDKSTNTLICCSRDSPDWSQLGLWCEDPQKCNLLIHRLALDDGGHTALQSNDTCSSYEMGFKSKMDLKLAAVAFRCSLANWNAQGIFLLSLDFKAYFLKDPITEKDAMLRISMDSSFPSYIGSPLRFNCTSTRYLFSYGLIWVGILDNGTTLLIDERLKGNTDLFRLIDFDSKSNEWIEVKIFSSSVKFISCLAPVWESDEWWNSTVAIELSESVKPSFDQNKNLQEVFISKDATEVVLPCQASGVPLPKIHWSKDSSDIRSATSENISDSEVYSELKVIPGKDMMKTLGTYVCEARNSVGLTRHLIQVQTTPTGPGLTIGITTGLVVFFTIALVILIRKVIKQKQALRHLTEAEIHEFEQGNPEALASWNDDINGCTHLLPYNNDYEIPPVNLTIDKSKILGQGTFGIVIKGSIRKGNEDILVAVKTIRPNEDVSNFKVLLSELKIMAYIGSHENIVCLVGASSRNIRNRELMIAIEFCDNGSLFQFLRANRSKYDKSRYPDLKESYVELYEFAYENEAMKAEYVNQPETRMTGYENDPNSSRTRILKFSQRDLISWAIQIANGMEFLASKRVVHADLATRNILLTADMRAKIGDFGLSKHLFEYSTYTKKTMALLPWKWMAIESLRDLEFSVKSDVWSYGVTLWEIFTLAEVPYPATSWTSEFLDSLETGMRLGQPKYSTPEIYEIILKCMRREPLSRPSFTTLKEWCTQLFLNAPATEHPLVTKDYNN